MLDPARGEHTAVRVTESPAIAASFIAVNEKERDIGNEDVGSIKQRTNRYKVF